MRVVQLDSTGAIQAITPLTVSSGASDAGKVVVLDAAGKWDTSVIPQTFDFDLRIEDLAGTANLSIVGAAAGASATLTMEGVSTFWVVRADNPSDQFQIRSTGTSPSTPFAIVQDAPDNSLHIAADGSISVVGSISGVTSLTASGAGSFGSLSVSGTSVVLETRSISSGDGLSGGGNLSANRTLTVDSTVVRTSGTQSIAGAKTFSDNVHFTGVNPLFARRGMTGSYGDDAPGSSNWGANIWSIGDSWDGSGYGSGFAVDASQYGLVWLRHGHPDRDTKSQEGLYFYRAGTRICSIGYAGAIFQGKRMLAEGNGFTISTSSPSGGENGDLWGEY